MNTGLNNRARRCDVFIYMAAAYGVAVLIMGVVGNEPELVLLGLAMMFLGNLHRLGKFLIKMRKRVIDVKT